MTTHSLFMPDRIRDYLVAVGVREPDLLRRLRAETAGLAEAHYQIAPEEGQLLSFLVELIGAERTLDIGTFTGYSALAVAMALPPHGRVESFDVSAEFTRIARRYWDEAGLADRIGLTLGPAVASLEVLAAGDGAGRFDFAFIDADKEGYPAYVELALRLVRVGGLIALDNTLWRGRVADPDDRRQKTRLFRALNTALQADDRVALTVLPVGDGVTLLRRRR